jgi:hypothetical protein
MSESDETLARRDTPVDLKRSVDIGFLSTGRNMLTQLAAHFDSSEDLQFGFESWEALRTLALRQRAAVAEESKRISFEEEMLAGALKKIGTVGAASDSAALLKRESAEFENEIQTLSSRIKEDLYQRVQKRCELLKVKLTLYVRDIGSNATMLHLGKLSEEEALIAMFLFSEKIPSRYGAHLDDSVDSVLLPEANVFVEESVDVSRMEPLALISLLNSDAKVIPMKGSIPMKVGTQWIRWVSRGPILEAEFIELHGYRNTMTRDEAEEVLGQFIQLKLSGKIELELGR